MLVAPWLALITSAGLAIITLLYVSLTASTLRETRAANARREGEIRQQQATAIAAWVDKGVPKDSKAELSIRVKNASDQPVYDVSIEIVDLKAGSLLTCPLGDGTLPPGECRDLFKIISNMPNNTTGEFRVKVAFVDAAGARWVREASGELREEPHMITSGVEAKVRSR